MYYIHDVKVVVPEALCNVILSEVTDSNYYIKCGGVTWSFTKANAN